MPRFRRRSIRKSIRGKASAKKASAVAEVSAASAQVSAVAEGSVKEEGERKPKEQGEESVKEKSEEKPKKEAEREPNERGREREKARDTERSREREKARYREHEERRRERTEKERKEQKRRDEQKAKDKEKEKEREKEKRLEEQIAKDKEKEEEREKEKQRARERELQGKRGRQEDRTKRKEVREPQQRERRTVDQSPYHKKGPERRTEEQRSSQPNFPWGTRCRPRGDGGARRGTEQRVGTIRLSEAANTERDKRHKDPSHAETELDFSNGDCADSSRSPPFLRSRSPRRTHSPSPSPAWAATRGGGGESRPSSSSAGPTGETDVGGISLLYIHVGALCQDLGGVATDLRKQGATILMVSAASSTIATELANFLEQPAQTMEDKNIRGSGDKAEDRPEVRYQTLTHENVIVCGRAGITKDVLWARDIKSDGLVCLAAEVRLPVHFCQMQNITVAVAAHDSGLQLDSYQQGQLQDLIHHADVRFLAGEFVGDLELLLGGMRQSFTVNLAAWQVWEVTPAVAGKAESYVCKPFYLFVVGPVNSVKTLPAGMPAGGLANAEDMPKLAQPLGADTPHCNGNMIGPPMQCLASLSR